MTMHIGKTIEWLIAAVKAAEDKHRPFPNNIERASNLLMEEVGEVAAVVNDLTRTIDYKGRKFTPSDLQMELIHVGSVVLQWLDRYASYEEEQLRHAEAEEYYRGAGCAVGKRSEGDGGGQLSPNKESGLRSADGGGERGAYRDMERDTAKDATAPHWVGTPADKAYTGGRDIHPSDDPRERDRIGLFVDRRRRAGTVNDRQPR